MSYQSTPSFEQPSSVPTDSRHLQHFLCGVAWTIAGLHHLAENFPADAAVIDKFADHADDFSEDLLKEHLPTILQDLFTSATKYLLPELLAKVSNAQKRFPGVGSGDNGGSFFILLPYRPETRDDLSTFLNGVSYAMEELHRERGYFEDPEFLDEFHEDAKIKIDRLLETYS
ncbi:hypothetical protein BDV96DRAFT_594796 [Lophiotrema nucula]|uniref:Uncharacterized protein n=1 Tax=Lophiotrema nucula TaxID=690887 RepID=A0A6A5ZQT6_9PLEO|nr:hypothetical protein BDV96DRAFT_594796 [Lophiotrema nucula]